MKRYQNVMQDDLKDCGVASLLTIIKTYGGEVSKEYLRDLTKTTKLGTNAYEIIEASKKIGFASKGVYGDVLEINDEMLPCIAHTVIDNKYKHFIVIHHIDRKHKKIIIADPSTGIKTMTYLDFKKISTNNFIILKPQKNIVNLKDNKLFPKLLFSILKKHKVLITLTFILSITLTLITIISTFQFQFIIDDAINYKSMDNLLFIIAIFSFIMFLRELTSYIRANLINSLNHKIDFILIKDVISFVIHLPYLYYKNRTTGEIISRINDINTLKDAISKSLISMIIDSVLIVISFLFLYKINKQLAIISLIFGIILYLIIYIFSKILSKYIKESKENAGCINSYLVETIGGIDTIKGLNIEEYTLDKINYKYQRYLNSSYLFNKYLIILEYLKENINIILMMIIMFIGGKHVIDSKLSLGGFVSFNYLLSYFLTPIKNVINNKIELSDSFISFQRISELYKIDISDNSLNHKYINKEIKGFIKTNHLKYSYNYKDFILKDINIDIKSGEKVIIYGQSGSGKSTLIKLIMKYLEVDNNSLFIDNKDINDYNLNVLKNNINYVSQNETLYTDTIYNNIILDNNINYDEFLKVIKLTLTEEITNKSILKENMLLEENGFNLSGGERQRIILARALLHNTNILLLDESLNEIDIKREREILSNIFNLYKDKTIIVISHRFNNIDLFDKKYEIVEGVSYEK
ncbi:MAG: peptidase domain-containing ABC transporter [Bacilli bacterium]